MGTSIRYAFYLFAFMFLWSGSGFLYQNNIVLFQSIYMGVCVLLGFGCLFVALKDRKEEKIKESEIREKEKDKLERDLELKKGIDFSLRVLYDSHMSVKKNRDPKISLLLSTGNESLVCLLNTKNNIDIYAGLCTTLKAVCYSIMESLKLSNFQFMNFYRQYEDGSIYAGSLDSFSKEQKEIIKKVFKNEDFSLFLESQFINKVFKIKDGFDIYTFNNIRNKYPEEFKNIDTLRPNLKVSSENIQKILDKEYQEINKKYLDRKRKQNYKNMLLFCISTFAGILLFLFMGSSINFHYSESLWVFPIHFSVSFGLAYIIWKNADGLIKFIFFILILLVIFYIISLMLGGDSCPGFFIRGQCEPY